MHTIKMRELTKKDWKMYKTLRLSSLKDSPESFCSTFELESAFQDAQWQARLNVTTRPERRVLVVAEINHVPLGVICGVTHAEDDHAAYVYQMWVSPDTRGLGVGKSLLNYIIHWAEGFGLQTLALSVTTTNSPAIKLYTALGFEIDGELEELRQGSALECQSMVLSLNSRSAYPGVKYQG